MWGRYVHRHELSEEGRKPDRAAGHATAEFETSCSGRNSATALLHRGVEPSDRGLPGGVEGVDIGRKLLGTVFFGGKHGPVGISVSKVGEGPLHALQHDSKLRRVDFDVYRDGRSAAATE